MNQIRNIAVSGVDTIEKYKKVCELCGSKKPYYEAFWTRLNRVVYDSKGSEYCMNDKYFMNDWSQQDYSHCTLYTYEDFIAKYDKEIVTDFTNTYCIANELHYDNLVLALQFHVKKLRIETTGYYLINNDKYGELIWFNSYDAMVKQFKPRQIEHNIDLNNWVYVKEPQEATSENTKPKQYQIGIDSFERMKANATKEEIIGACKLNIDKYIWRNKGSDIEDLKKAKDYINLWIETLEGEQ